MKSDEENARKNVHLMLLECNDRVDDMQERYDEKICALMEETDALRYRLKLMGDPDPNLSVSTYVDELIREKSELEWTVGKVQSHI